MIAISKTSARSLTPWKSPDNGDALTDSARSARMVGSWNFMMMGGGRSSLVMDRVITKQRRVDMEY